MVGEPGHCRARKRPPWWPSRTAVFFLQNVLQLHQQRWVILRVDSWALWKIINEEDTILIPKNLGEKFSSGFLHSGFCGGGVIGYAATPLIVAVSPGHSDITRLRPWSPIAPERKSFGSRRKNSKCCSDGRHCWRFSSAFRHFGTHFAENIRMSKSSWMMSPTHSREMFSCSAIDLAEIWRSSKISSWISSIISGVVTVLGRPGRGSSQVEKSPRLNWATQFLTVAYYGVCCPNVSVLMVWISFSALPCRKKKTWWQLASWCCWNRARRLTCFLSGSVTRKDLQFCTRTDPSFQRHYRFRPTTSGIRSG